MERCQTCQNNIKARRVFLDYKGPKGKARYIYEPYCWYCEWKGTVGPGQQLRKMIKEHNDE